MRNFLHFTASGLRRTVLAPSFVGAAVGQCALSLLSVYEEITLVGADSTASYLYEMGIYANFWVLFLLFGAIPGATLFCTDWENRYIRFSAARAGKAAYGAGTAAACYLAGTGAVFVGSGSFGGAVPGLSPSFPGEHCHQLLDEHALRAAAHPQRILLFYAARFLIKACCAGFFSVAALWVSTLLPNVFVALASPLLLNYLWENVAIFLKLPAPAVCQRGQGEHPHPGQPAVDGVVPRGAVHRACGGVRGAVYGGGQKEAGAWLNCARPRCWRPTTFKSGR